MQTDLRELQRRRALRKMEIPAHQQHTSRARPESPIFTRSRGWGDFPDVVIAARLGDASKSPDYADAKAGDIYAAERLAASVLTQQSVDQLAALLDGQPATLVPVLAEESSGRNKIPLAAAQLLSEQLDLPVSADIAQASKVSRTGSDGLQRLARQPSFAGTVKSGKNYVLVDDTLTQGGTFAQLKEFIELRGGKVLAAVVLTGKQYSARIKPNVSTVAQLRQAYGAIEPWWNTEFGHGFDGLTESEARYILKSGLPADTLRDRLAAMREADRTAGIAATSGMAQNGVAL